MLWANPLSDQVCLIRTLSQVNADQEEHGRVAQILIAKDNWSIQNGHLTHTLKIKRAQLEASYLLSAQKCL